MHKKLDPIEKKIAGVKKELMSIGEMRPGSLTYQYQRPKEKKGGFYQISDLLDEEQNRIRQGRVRTRPQRANCDFQAIQKTHPAAGRSIYTTLADEN